MRLCEAERVRQHRTHTVTLGETLSTNSFTVQQILILFSGCTPMQITSKWCIAINIIVAIIIGSILWFSVLHGQGAGDRFIVAWAFAPFVAMGFLAWLCGRWKSTSLNLLIISAGIAVVGIAIVGSYGLKPPPGEGSIAGFEIFFAWIGHCMVVAIAYMWCLAIAITR
jgi:hypothetical protein